MALDLCRAVYTSKAASGAGANLLSISEILGISDRNNRRENLTGVLLFHAGYFLRALEGERSAIQRLLNTLGRDTRHRTIAILSFEPVTHRSFGDWTMGQATITPDVAPLLAGRSLETLSADEALELLTEAVKRIPRPH